MIASIWQNFGINMLFFMTGLQAIPPEMYEAASIDGASNTRQFLTITIPLLGPVLQMVLMNAILGSLKVTDLVLTLTNGKMCIRDRNKNEKVDTKYGENQNIEIYAAEILRNFETHLSNTLHLARQKPAIIRGFSTNSRYLTSI